MIYVLVPAHNEAPTVGLLLWKVRQLFTSFNREYQLLVVNDGSTDGTDDVLAPYTRALPLSLTTHRQRRGYAKSLETLLRETIRRTDRPRRDFAVTIQADFSESPEDLLELIKRLEGGADVVVPDRRGRAGAGHVERFARSALASLVRRKLSLEGAADVVGTMRGYRLVVIEHLVREAGNGPILTREGWAADLELLAKLAPHARRIESVVVRGERPSSARPSRLRPALEAWRALRASGSITAPAPAAAPSTEAPATWEDAERLEERPAESRAGGRPDGRTAEGRTGGRADGRTDRKHRHEERRERHAKRGRKGGRADARSDRPAAAAAERPTAGPPDRPDRPAPDGPTAGPPDRPPQVEGAPAAQGGSRRRRRRGRGRGRNRGNRPGPTQGPQQAPAPSPAAPPPAA